ncbi:MAG: LCP family protein [Parcubacteria group bacterium]|nr:LCP family protein [Parcubacteria group bacterium]
MKKLPTTEKSPKLDLLRNQEGLDVKSKKTKRGLVVFGKIALVLFIVVAILGALFSYKLMTASKNIFSENEDESIIQQIKKLVFSKDKYLAGEEEGRTNILLLGMGGEGHQGAYLTDTIIVVSIKYNGQDTEKDVSMISIPRDLYVKVDNQNYYRINSLYTLGKVNQDEYESGMTLINDAISNITGLPIHYYVRADFDGFKKVIDSLDGIEVYVDNSFYDAEYPTENYGYQTVVFKKGTSQMDGDKALKFARSRHGVTLSGEGSEASDFSRAKRQQKILVAVRDKALSLETIINPKKISEGMEALGDHIRTNLEPWETMRLTEMAQEINRDEIINKVVDHGESGLLYSTTASSGAYVLLPKEDDYSAIKSFCQNIFDVKYLKREDARIEVLNGTSQSGLAQDIADQLSAEDYNIVSIGNATALTDTPDTTIIYTFGEQTKETTLKKLKEKFGASKIETLDDRSKIVDPKTTRDITVDIIILLGPDSNSLAKQ